MSPAPRPDFEHERLMALEDSGALGATAILGLDRIVATAASKAGTPIALVSFIGAERQWVKASVGMTIDHTDRDSAFCAWAVYSADVLWVEDALEDARFFDNPLVDGDPHIRHYAGAPIITPEGYVLGTVCVIDSKPRAFDPTIAPMLVGLAEEVSQVLRSAAPVRTPRREPA